MTKPRKSTAEERELVERRTEEHAERIAEERAWMDEDAVSHGEDPDPEAEPPRRLHP